MGLFTSKELDSFETLYLDQLSDLYDAEQQLLKALPKMAEAAYHPELKAAFQKHLLETQSQLSRLDRAFELMNESPRGTTCHAMKGLIAEGQEIVAASGDTDVKDAALIAAAQRAEHYEIAGYGTARSFAERLGQDEAARLLQESLNEEQATDEKLTQLAEEHINAQAALT
jgi:ferritin-like metal-binding protein YciE